MEQLDIMTRQAQFGRWQAYAIYVKCVALNKGKLTREKRQFLLHRAAHGPLLPCLETLLLSTEQAYDGDPGHGLLRPNTIDAEHLTMLLLSPSLHTLTMSFAYLEYVNLEILTSRTPKLHNLHIGVPTVNSDHTRVPLPKRYQAMLGHRPGHPSWAESKLGYLADVYDLVEHEGIFQPGDLDPLGGMEECIVNWRLMSTMTIGGRCLELVDLTILTQLHLLVSLTIVDPPYGLDWDFYAASSTRFVSLQSLTLQRTGPKVASLLFECPFVVSRVCRIYWGEHTCAPAQWDGDNVPEEIYNAALRNLAATAACLQYLSVYCMYSSSSSWWCLSRIFRPLDDVDTLSELRVVALDEQQDSRPLSNLPGPVSLERLTIEHAPVSMTALPLVAWSFPQLRYLSILLDLCTGIPTAIQTFGPALQVVQLSLKLRMATHLDLELEGGKTELEAEMVT